ncbi:Gfo/Idh/MocA family protein [Trebonia sp.]|uniref:Gfo/Idh/MocA family protein n=1 Tax=Trebonia sp. TaxID=2767075 RepID=UPI003BAEAF79
MRARAGEIRVGVVGVGYWGSRHVRVLRATTGVGAVIGVDQRFAEIGDGRREAEPGIAAYADIEEALPHVDAVVIATPPASHAPLALKAIAAGKHVLVEKPMATTTAAARMIVDAAAAAGVVLMPGHTFEHNAAVHKLRDLVRGGHLGRLFYLDCARLNLGLYQSDVNVIFDLASHDISISNFVLGARPTAVTVWGARHVHPEHEDVAYLRLEYGDLGVRSNIHVSWLDPRKVRRITAVGSAKMAEYDDMADEERIRVYDKSAIPPDGNGGPLSGVAYHLGDMVAPFVPFAEPLAVQDQQFVDCIAGDSSPSVDGSNGLAVVQALECAQISLREQRPVTLAEVAQRQARSQAGLDAAFAGTPVG